MSKIRRLVDSYSRYISVPWRSDAAAAQRVIFCVYNEDYELHLRAKIDEFEIATKQSGHEWAVYDLTDTFSDWLSRQRYAKSYYKNPQLLSTRMPNYLAFIKQEFENFLHEKGITEKTVVALKGVGSIFGFLMVKEIVGELAPLVAGRLLVFFPGNYEDDNYRLFDAYDGWNYLAVPITADKEVLN